MIAHHKAWLSAHPDRDETWLAAMVAAGFDIHHLDGDHANNDPANLVLIEHVDHMRLHGAPGNRLGAAKAFLHRPKRAKQRRPTVQEVEGKRWRERKMAERERRLSSIALLD